MRNHGYFCCTLFCVLYFCSFCHGLWNFFPSFCKINVGITIFCVLMASSFFSSFLYCFSFFGLFLFFSSFIDAKEEAQQMGCRAFLFALAGRGRSRWRGAFIERFGSVGPPSPSERIVWSRAPPDRTFGRYRRP